MHRCAGATGVGVFGAGVVTGATGFTGGHLAQHLMAHGVEVRALVRSRWRGRVDRCRCRATV